MPSVWEPRRNLGQIIALPLRSGRRKRRHGALSGGASYQNERTEGNVLVARLATRKNTRQHHSYRARNRRSTVHGTRLKSLRRAVETVQCVSATRLASIRQQSFAVLGRAYTNYRPVGRTYFRARVTRYFPPRCFFIDLPWFRQSNVCV